MILLISPGNGLHLPPKFTVLGLRPPRPMAGRAPGHPGCAVSPYRPLCPQTFQRDVQHRARAPDLRGREDAQVTSDQQGSGLPAGHSGLADPSQHPLLWVRCGLGAWPRSKPVRGAAGP